MKVSLADVGSNHTGVLNYSMWRSYPDGLRQSMDLPSGLLVPVICLGVAPGSSSSNCIVPLTFSSEVTVRTQNL